MLAHNGNTGNIFKGNGNILQIKSKLRDISHGIYKKRT
jgi:hypothetical protein